jgi:hypothetical protein
MGLIDEKTESRKSRDTVSLSSYFILLFLGKFTVGAEFAESVSRSSKKQATIKLYEGGHARQEWSRQMKFTEDWQNKMTPRTSWYDDLLISLMAKSVHGDAHTIRYITTRYNTIRYNTTRYNTTRHITIRYITTRYSNNSLHQHLATVTIRYSNNSLQ